MKHRICAGALVVKEDTLLVVNHKKPGAYDFWVAPGGGVQGTESLEEAVVREVKEEAGIIVEVQRLMYIEELYHPEERSVKLWYLCSYVSGEPDSSADEAVVEYIVHSKFMSKAELSTNLVFPTVVKDRFWADLLDENHMPQLFKMREMEFY